jgi:F-type H+-transporting ATPase subunit delta
MIISQAANRYASMFLELGKDRDEVQDLLEDMEFINNTLNDSRELVLFLKSPIIKHSDKQQVLETLFTEKIQESTRLLLQLLVRKNRIEILHQIAQAFIKKYREYAGIIEVQAITGYAMSDSQKKALQQKLEEITSKEVHLSVQEDPSVQGGMAVRIEDTVIDGTIKHQLQELQDQFLSSAVVK